MERVVGIDMARGVAVLGMFTAHVGSAADDFWSPTGWLQVADGRSAAGFALLAGVSAALLSGGPQLAQGTDLKRARIRILARAAALLPLGYLLIALGTPVAVILPGYALMFALVTVALTWSTRSLLLAAALFATVGPLLVAAVHDGPLASGPLAGLVVGRYYPAAVWMAYLLVGLAIGRMDLLAPASPRRLALWGVAGVVVGYGTSAVVLPLVDPTSTLAGTLLTARPHANTAPEVVGNIGAVLCLLALCLVAARRFPRQVTPVAATGALALTAYCGHLVAIALLGNDVVWSSSNPRLIVFVLVTLVLTTAWHVTVGRGPLEQGLHRMSTAVARAVVPTADPLPEAHRAVGADADR